MSSAVLYFAIVAVWAIVLVPMWLRRDTEKSDEFEEEHTEPEPSRPRAAPSRAKVIARRRRRTAGLTALLATAGVVAASGVAPWWIIAPPTVLLAGHLALLRVAVGMDAANREAAARARAREAAAARRAPETPETPEASEASEPVAAEPAEIIELPAPQEVFDQYADDRRAVGE